MPFDVHALLLDKLDALLRERVEKGWDKELMSQAELARRSGVHQSVISAMQQAGRPALEQTWDKLFNAATDQP